MNRLTIVAMLVLSVGATSRTAYAQVAAPAALRANDNPHTVLQSQARPGKRSPYEFPARMALGELPVRMALGVGGAWVGAVGGMVFGANVLYQGNCACEDPGLGEALLGAAVGSVISSGVFAAVPSFSSTCSTSERIERGVGGSLAGALVGGVLGSTMGPAGFLMGYLGGAGLGAGLSAAC